MTRNDYILFKELLLASMNQYSLTAATKILVSHYHGDVERTHSTMIDSWITHKVRHIYAVLFCAQKILATSEELRHIDRSLRKKCEIAALLHDIGRFYQHDDDRIYRDSEYEHGDEAYHILAREGYTDPAILLAVKYHNKRTLDDLPTDPDYVHATNKDEIDIACRVVRDADKLQNLEYYILDNGQNFHIFMGQTEGGIRPEAIQEFKARELVSFKHVESTAEKIFCLASWVNDIHYNGTRRALREV